MKYHNCYHHNEWPWGKTVTIITQDGAGIIEMSFEKDNPGVCYVSGLSVLPNYRKKGIATYLMNECINYCLTDNIENYDNPIFRIDLNSVMEPFVLDFYHKLGFTDIKEGEGYMRMYKIIVPTKPIVLK
jgi:ribosomal protein S18 acetylase RimI-like enzyme